MTDAALSTASPLPTDLASHSLRPEGVEDESWDLVHVGTADAPDHGARALMRTSDGDFRISATEVDGKVGLTIEKYRPHETAGDSGESSPAEQEETDTD